MALRATSTHNSYVMGVEATNIKLAFTVNALSASANTQTNEISIERTKTSQTKVHFC